MAGRRATGRDPQIKAAARVFENDFRRMITEAGAVLTRLPRRKPEPTRALLEASWPVVRSNYLAKNRDHPSRLNLPPYSPVARPGVPHRADKPTVRNGKSEEWLYARAHSLIRCPPASRDGCSQSMLIEHAESRGERARRTQQEKDEGSTACVT
jgi:hypothetical protein